MALLGLTAGTLVIAVVATAAVMRLSSNVTTVDISPAAGPAAAEPPPAPYDGAFDVLLVGSDSRSGQGEQFQDDSSGSGGRNDVTLLLHVDAQHEAATVVSFPRDLLVDMPECNDADTGRSTRAESRVQFNAALGRGGLGCVATTVGSLTQLPIRYAAEVSFQGVIDLSSAVGGVPVCFAGPVHDRRSGFHIAEAGTVSLEGEQALAYLRTRHGIGDGSDLARISAQQIFLASLVRTLRDRATFSDPLRTFSIADTATKSMTLSTDMADPAVLVSMAAVLSGLPDEAFRFVTYPYLPAGNRVIPDPAAAENLIDALHSAGAAPIDTRPGRAVDEELPVETSESSETPEPASPGATSPVNPLDLEGQTGSEATCVAP